MTLISASTTALGVLTHPANRGDQSTLDGADLRQLGISDGDDIGLLMFVYGTDGEGLLGQGELTKAIEDGVLVVETDVSGRIVSASVDKNQLAAQALLQGKETIGLAELTSFGLSEVEAMNLLNTYGNGDEIDAQGLADASRDNALAVTLIVARDGQLELQVEVGPSLTHEEEFPAGTGDSRTSLPVCPALLERAGDFI